MADVQLENGAMHIALELQAAIMRFDFSGLERRVLDAVMRYTYAAGKSRAIIKPEDVRLMVEGKKRVRTDRIEQVLVKLNKQNVLTSQDWNGGALIGIQKDFEHWSELEVDKVSTPLQELVYINNTNTGTVVDKVSTPTLLVAYSQNKSGFKHELGAWRMERSWAGKVYRKVLTLTNDPESARELIEDYIDENEWMRRNIQRQFAYMYTRFDQWYRQIPSKPRPIREDEEALGRRFRYHVKNKVWEVVV